MRQNPANVQLGLSTRNFSWARAISGRRKANSVHSQSARFQKKCNLARGRTPPQLQITHLRTRWLGARHTKRSDRPGLIFTFHREINRLLRLGARPYLIMRGARGHGPRACWEWGPAPGAALSRAAAGGGRPPAHSHTPVLGRILCANRFASAAQFADQPGGHWRRRRLG